MNNKKDITFYISIFIFCIVFITLCYGVMDKQNALYECVDTLGNKVYCTRVTSDYGIKYGITQNGAKVQVVQYKRIENEKN